MSSGRDSHHHHPPKLSDEEFARRLQYEEQQQQQQSSSSTSRNIDTGRYTKQELDDLALARQYAQMYSDDNNFGATRQQLRSPPQPQKSYNSTRTSNSNSNQYNHQRLHTTSRTESGINVNAISLGAHTYSPQEINVVNEHDNQNHYRIGMDRSHTSSSHNHQHRNASHIATNNSSSSTTSVRDPFDYTSDSVPRNQYYQSPPSQKEVVGPPQQQQQQMECHPSFHAHFDRAVNNFMNGTSSSAAVEVTEEDHDLELARRMQALEDCGLGKRNSDRTLDSIMNGDDIGFVEAIKKPSSSNVNELSTAANHNSNNKNSNFESLAQLLTDSGADMNTIPDDLLRELLGSDNHHNNSNHHHSSQQLLSETGATTTTVTMSPSKASQQSSRIVSGRSMRSNSSSNNNNALSRNGVSPKPGKTSSTSTPAGILKDFDHSNLNDIILPTDSNHASKNNNNKVKRRGIFGFALADKNKFNLDQITMDAPTTNLMPIPAVSSPPPTPSTLVTLEQNLDRKLKQSPPPSGGVTMGGIPAAIPPAPSGGMSLHQRQAQSVPPNATMQLRSPTVIPTPTGNIIIPPSVPSGIPSAIPPKPVGMMTINQSFNGLYRGTNICSACGLSHGTFLKVLDRKYHPECFRCTSCNGKIDPFDQFKYTTDDKGRVHPHHRECFNTFGVQCCVCQQKVPVTPDGRVPFIKHPFFSSEVMCVRHADEDIRRCCGCQRLEPYDKPYIDLMDEDRCVCPICCQSVVVDSSEAKPLWMSVLMYLEQKLKLPIWGPLRDIPILMVGVKSLQEQMSAQGSMHGVMSQNILAAGLCLTESRDPHHRSYSSSYNTVSPSRPSNVVAILCPTGLPRALVASILAHESVHAWIQLHPNYYSGRPLSSQIVEGLCQLVASLYLSDGVIPNNDSNVIDGTSEKKLRQYYKFCIERDQSDIFGNGYRRAAVAYRDIGMEGLLSHILEYRDFPPTSDDDGIILG